jgi:hypothetical protein
MVLKGHYIISWEIWKPLFRLLWNSIGVSLDGGHVKGFVEVLFPRESNWSKGKGIMEKGFDNERLEKRPYLVYLGRI